METPDCSATSLMVTFFFMQIAPCNGYFILLYMLYKKVKRNKIINYLVPFYSKVGQAQI